MGKADVYESDYLENGEIFADLVNGVLYQGRQVVKAHELSEQDGELRSISGDSVKKTIRDKVRLWNGMVITIIIYYGREKPWDGARTLFELLDMKGKEKQVMGTETIF